MVSPTFSFWLGVFVSIFVGVGSGTVHLTNMVPADWIPVITAWMNFLGFAGTVTMTALAGLSSRSAGPLVK
jgi:hypothetical protein